MKTPRASSRPGLPMTPSSRDGIESWLDVLTAMLNLPASQKALVRDELEDHLRSRVDDLLILGKPEPEAIRAAVAELGETAELAKLISSAHTRSHPRRYIMNTILTAAAVTGLTLGTLSLMPSATLPIAAQGSGAQMAQIAETADAQDPTHEFDLNQSSVWNIMEEVAQAFGRKVVVSDQLRGSGFVSAAGNQPANLRGEYTFEEAMEKVRAALNEGGFGEYLAVTNTELHLISQEEYKRSQIEMIAHAAPEWVKSQTEMYNYASALERLLKVKHDLKYTSIEVVGNAIVVAAPLDIQSEIEELSAQLKHFIERDRQRDQQEQAMLDAQRNEAIAGIKSEYQRARKVLSELQHRLDLVQTQIKNLGTFEDPNTVGSLSREDIDTERNGLRLQARDLEFQVNEYLARCGFLQDTLIHSEYEELTSRLDLPSDTATSTGPSARAGEDQNAAD